MEIQSIGIMLPVQSTTR